MLCKCIKVFPDVIYIYIYIFVYFTLIYIKCKTTDLVAFKARPKGISLNSSKFGFLNRPVNVSVLLSLLFISDSGESAFQKP